MKLQFLHPTSKFATSSSNCHSSKVQLLVNSDDHEAYLSSQSISIVVPNNLFKKNSHCSNKVIDDDDDTFLIKPFHNVQIRTNKNKKNDIVLEDTLNNVPIAVCRMMCNGLKPCKIYTTTPNYQGQKPSKQTYTSNKGGNATTIIALYTYGDITISNGNRSNPVFTLLLTGNCSLANDEGRGCVIDKKDDRKYTIMSIGTLQRGVLKNGKQIALLESKLKNMTSCSGKTSYTSYTRINVTPEIDPCLMICLSAICSYIDNNTVHE